MSAKCWAARKESKWAGYTRMMANAWLKRPPGKADEMNSSLDHRILAALAGHRTAGGVQDFHADPSAIKKAQQVLDIMHREGFAQADAVLVSVGGADGTELEHILQTTEARYGLLLEYDDRLSDRAREKALRLRDDRDKFMEVFTGDALQKIDPALRRVDNWREAGVVGTIVLTMHAVLHEFPNRGGGTEDLEGFLHKFLWRRLPVLAIAREPCMPDGLPPVVYLSADCRPDNLANLARRIQSAHSEFLTEMAPAPMAKSVRMSSRLAIETVAKLFYLESLPYEIEERITSFTKQELVGAFRNVFETENVRTETLQTDSVHHLWRELGIVLQDEDHRELAKPELHVRIVAKWRPPDAARFPGMSLGGVPSTMRRPANSATGSSASAADSERLGTATCPADDSALAGSSTGLIITSASTNPTPPLDLWTPGPAREDVIAYYDPIVGRGTAERLWTISKAAISAVASGDFQRQVDIGCELERIASDHPYLMAEGAYFTAEGLRLLADMERSSEKAADLRKRALENYRRSSAGLPYDPRPIRGIGRILEVRGDYDEALGHLKHAKGLCLTGLASTDATRRPDLAHEMLRTARHLIHCVLEIRAKSPLSQWNRENKRPEIEGLIAECDNYHRDYMPTFEKAESWWLIEWFMGLVFLARAWAEVGYQEKAKQSLVYALAARRKLIGHDAHLSAVERTNLRWWLSVARDRTTSFDPRSRELVERLAAAVDQGQRQGVHQAIDDLLLPVLPPWDRGGSP